MPKLGSHPNVYETCLQSMRREGWQLWSNGGLAAAVWIARKDGIELTADNPIELLGLVGIHDRSQPGPDPQPYWWRAKDTEERVHDQLEAECQLDKADAADWRTRPAWAGEIRRAWENAEVNFSSDASPETLVAEAAAELGFGPVLMWAVFFEMGLLQTPPPKKVEEDCYRCGGTGRLEIHE